MTRTGVIVLLALGAAVLAAGGGLLLAWPQAAIDPADAEQVALGRGVYADHCAACHGAQLEGEADWQTRREDGRMPAPPHDATGHTWHHPDETLFRITKHGIEAFAPPGYQSDMPAFADVLSDTEIRAVLAFIKSTWPEEIRRRHAAIQAQAAR
ncbi:c-type cytochrome [Azospirillum halopraeferens]|uniref:c-type cytochrome n=1 Tax=Azospirillum halopraeferens TaxID=34010 RepID=UPI0004277222|nr:cytochrome c [Azospirillum halopraeferens]